MRAAARSYMDARDFEAALRCYRAAKDERGAARACERLGRVNEALAIWAKLGRPREIARLRKKFPLAKAEKMQKAAKGPREEGQKELF